jgi:hypothetical protein
MRVRSVRIRPLRARTIQERSIELPEGWPRSQFAEVWLVGDLVAVCHITEENEVEVVWATLFANAHESQIEGLVGRAADLADDHAEQFGEEE